MPGSPIQARESDGYRFVDAGPHTDHPPVLLLHGMLGDLSNWTSAIQALVDNNYRVLVPVLPVYDLPLTHTSVSGLVDYVRAFLQHIGIESTILVGNSLGGHVALVYAMRFPQYVPAMILSGASGIYEMNIGTTMPRRQDRGYIRERAAVTFYDPIHVTENLVDEMFSIMNDRGRVARLIKMARSTKKETVTDHLEMVTSPTLLVWGQDDVITPPSVAYEFLERMPNATLYFIERCGHAPMIERPEEFNRLMLDFLSEMTVPAGLTTEIRSAR